ncbi:MAG: ABC transporter permease [Candidatus Woesearchaeota archaeon]
MKNKYILIIIVVLILFSYIIFVYKDNIDNNLNKENDNTYKYNSNIYNDSSVNYNGGIDEKNNKLNVLYKNNSNSSTVNDSGEESGIFGGVSGGGSGAGSGENTYITDYDFVSNNSNNTILNTTTYYSLEEVFNDNNPLNKKVSIRGIAFQVSGVNMYDYFFFTDDETIINNPHLILIQNARFHITVYNRLIDVAPQSIVKINGIINECEGSSQGVYCIKALKIE